MEWMQLNINDAILSWVLFLPLLGALLIFIFPQRVCRWLCLGTCLIDFTLSLHLPFHFDSQSIGLQYVEKISWIPAFGVHYALGIDGISLWLVMLTTFLGPLVVMSAWNSIKKHTKAFFAMLLILQTGMLGAFMASDLFLFYIFWEAMLIPMYLIIGVWGGERRLYAAMKFFIFTMAGSLFMLVGVIAVFMLYKAQFGIYTGDIQTLYHLDLPQKAQIALFAAFGISFAIKVPVFLLHTWLPDAHVEAPTAGSVVLAGVLLKMGTYGFLRFAMPLFPLGLAYFSNFLLWLAVIGIIYGALVAMVQTDIKRLVAYSSVSHLGYVMLGILVLNFQGVHGGIYQMLNHGLSTGGLFLLVGMIYERRHTREIKEFGGLARSIPLFTFCLLIITLSSIGLPGLNGFVGEFLILFGAFRAHKFYCIVAGIGLILGAIYMLWMVERVAFGKLKVKNSRLPDLSFREVLILLPILVMVVVMGVFPKPFLDRMSPSVGNLVRQIKFEQRAYLEDRSHVASSEGENSVIEEPIMKYLGDYP